MATTTQINRPAPFVEKLGTNLAENVLAQQGTPVVSQGLASLGTMAQPNQQSFETADQFKTRQDLFGAQQRAALGFEQRQQALGGLAPQVAGQDVLQQTAQTLAQQGAGIDPTTGKKTGLASFEPFLNTAGQQAGEASRLGGAAETALGTAASTFGGLNTQNLLGTGVDTRTAQQKAAGDPASLGSIESYMSPYQSQVIDASLEEFDRNSRIQEQRIRDQQASLGALGSGRAGVQLAEYGTGAARERALLNAGLLQQGFGQAQAGRQQDIQNRFNLGTAQQGIAGATQGLGSFQSGLAGQQAGLGAQTQALQGTDISRLGQLGALNQAQQQADFDATREANRMATFQPQEQLDRFAGQVTGIMGGYPGQTQTTNIPNPTPLQTALGVGTTLAGIYGGLSGKFGNQTNFGDYIK